MRERKTVVWCALGALVCALALAGPARAIDPGFTDTSAFTSTPPPGPWYGMNWDSVGLVTNIVGSSFGSCVAISDRYLLTASHVSSGGADRRFRVDYDGYSITYLLAGVSPFSPTFGDDGPDLALLKVDRVTPVAGETVIADWAGLYQGAPHLTEEIIISGHGYTSVPSQPWCGKRWGSNRIYDYWINTSYDDVRYSLSSEDETTGDYESLPGMMDSGGGMFARVDDDTWGLAGTMNTVVVVGGGGGVALAPYADRLKKLTYIADFGAADGDMDADDIDTLAANLGTTSRTYDLDGDYSNDTTVDDDDFVYMVENLVQWENSTEGGYGTYQGDVNLDGVVDQTDLDIIEGNLNESGGWVDGDMNGDGQVDDDDVDLWEENENAEAAASFDYLRENVWQHSPGTPEDWSDGDSWTRDEPNGAATAVIDNGGTVEVTTTGEVSKKLALGGESSGDGTLEIETGGELDAEIVEVGRGGDGTITQTGGALDVEGDVILGLYHGSSGSYTLSAGALDAGSLHVGFAGDGDFSQSGGTVTVGNLTVGDSSQGTASYDLTDGNVYASLVVLSDGDFDQSGGYVSASSVLRIAGGEYTLSGGEIDAGSAYVTGGNFTMSAGEITVTDPWEVAGGTVSQSGGTAATDNLTIDNGSYALSGGSLTADDTLTLGGDEHGTRFEWSGGTLSAAHVVFDGAGISGGPFWSVGVTWTMGLNFDVDDFADGSLFGVSSTMSGLQYCALGVSNGATATHNNDSVTLRSLGVGANSGEEGRYVISSTAELEAGVLAVGVFGTGTFTQSGGDVDVSRDLLIGAAPTADGTYTFSGGTLTVTDGEGGANLIISNVGTGRFEWVNSTTDALTADEIILGSNGTLAMQFNFKLADLVDGSLFGDGTMTGLANGTLEVSNDANATVDGTGTYTVGTLNLGTTSSDGHMTVSSADATLQATSITLTDDGWVGPGPHHQNRTQLAIYGGAIEVSGGDIQVNRGCDFLLFGGSVSAEDVIVTDGTVSHNWVDVDLTGDLTVSGSGMYLLNLSDPSGSLDVDGDIRVTSTGTDVNATLAWGKGDTALSANSITLSGPSSGYRTAPSLGLGFDFTMDELVDGSLFGGTLNGLDSGALILIDAATLTHNHTSASPVDVRTLKIGIGTSANTPRYTVDGSASLAVQYLIVAQSRSGVLDIDSTSADITVEDLLLFRGSGAQLEAVTGSAITIDSGMVDFASGVDESNLADLNNLTLVFDGGSNALEAACEDLGLDLDGFNGNFALAEIELLDDAYLDLVDSTTHFPTNGDALYVVSIVIGEGATFRTNGIPVYYQTMINDGTTLGTFTLVTGGGPVPEPATIGLLALGGGALLRRKRR